MKSTTRHHTGVSTPVWLGVRSITMRQRTSSGRDEPGRPRRARRTCSAARAEIGVIPAPLSSDHC
jgi:hypothetical protein